jgi:hypothetical protein
MVNKVEIIAVNINKKRALCYAGHMLWKGVNRTGLEGLKLFNIERTMEFENTRFSQCLIMQIKLGLR